MLRDSAVQLDATQLDTDGKPFGRTFVSEVNDIQWWLGGGAFANIKLYLHDARVGGNIFYFLIQS